MPSIAGFLYPAIIDCLTVKEDYMLDIKYIRNNIDIVRNAIKVKHCNCDLDKLLKLDTRIVSLKTELQHYNEQVNLLSKKIPSSTDISKKNLIEQSKNIGLKAKSIETELNSLIIEFNNLIMSVPQIPDSNVIVGNDDSDNIVIKQCGTKTVFDFNPKDQIEPHK